MMYSKAMLFLDNDSAKMILNEKQPGKQKEIGRRVKGFKNELWKQHKKSIVYKGNYEKFYQNKELKNRLVNTGNAILAEANPKDLIWGIGLSESDAINMHPSQWRGKNLLGRILMEIRLDLQKWSV